MYLYMTEKVTTCLFPEGNVCAMTKTRLDFILQITMGTRTDGKVTED